MPRKNRNDIQPSGERTGKLELTRRDLLKTAAAVAAVSTVVPRTALADATCNATPMTAMTG